MSPDARADAHGGAWGLPDVINRLLLDVAADGFHVWTIGHGDPDLIGGWYRWQCGRWTECVDLFAIKDFKRGVSAAARAVAPVGTVDTFDPRMVVWGYQGEPEDVLRALLTQPPHPDHPDAPDHVHLPPPLLRLSESDRRIAHIRPPRLRHAGVRAARLQALMPS